MVKGAVLRSAVEDPGTALSTGNVSPVLLVCSSSFLLQGGPLSAAHVTVTIRDYGPASTMGVLDADILLGCKTQASSDERLALLVEFVNAYL